MPDDADKLGLVRVVELYPCAFAIRVHFAPPLMKLNCGCGLARNARMSSASRLRAAAEFYPAWPRAEPQTEMRQPARVPEWQ